MNKKFKSDIYKCKKCGQEVIILKVGKGTLVCCEKPMEKLDDEKIYEFGEEDEEAEE
jgi:superoxide reductase